MMAAILNSAILDSAILNKTLTQTNSIWLKLLHSHSTWWCQLSWILPSWIQPFYTKNFTHSFWLNLMLAAIFNLAISNSAILVFPLKLTHTCQDWFPPFPPQKKLHSLFPLHHLHKILHSFNLTQLDDGSHLEFGHLGFSHLSFSSQTHPCLPRLVPTISTKKTSLTLPSSPFAQNTSLIQSDSTWWWQPSWVWPSWIQSFCTKKTSLIHSDSTWWWQPSWILPTWIPLSWIQPS